MNREMLNLFLWMDDDKMKAIEAVLTERQLTGKKLAIIRKLNPGKTGSGPDPG